MVATILLWWTPAWAQSVPDAGEPSQAAALALFQEGRRLLAAGEIARACAKLAESHRLDPGGGTLLNLALCHEQQGRLATAWAEYQDALGRARVDRRADRIAFAENRLAQIEPRLPRVEIVVLDPDSSAIQVELNGTVLGEAAWGSMVPVDPGLVTVEATAPGKRPWIVRKQVVEGQLLTISVEPLLDAPGPAPRSGPVPKRQPPRRRSSPRWPYAVAAGGLTGLGVSGAFTWLALDRRQASDEQCPAGRCTAAGVAYNEHAQTLADVATGAAILGLVGVAVGAWGLWSSSDDESPSWEVSASPTRWTVTAAF